MQSHPYQKRLSEEFLKFLKEKRACPPAVRWVEEETAAGKTVQQIWQECNSQEWMMWLVLRSTHHLPHRCRHLMEIFIRTVLLDFDSRTMPLDEVDSTGSIRLAVTRLHHAHSAFECFSYKDTSYCAMGYAAHTYKHREGDAHKDERARTFMYYYMLATELFMMHEARTVFGCAHVEYIPFDKLKELFHIQHTPWSKKVCEIIRSVHPVFPLPFIELPSQE